LLSDVRAAEALFHAKAARYGVRRVAQLLHARGLPAELVHETLGRARDTELARALAIWRRRFGAPPQDAQSRARQQRFLLGRGFEPSTIHRLMRTVADGGADDAGTVEPADDDGG
jgi:regulatory protein